MKKGLLLSLSFLLSFAILSQEKKVKLLFAGDAMQHKSQLDAAKTKDGYNYSQYFKHIKHKLDSVDLAVVNLETTLPGKAYTGYPCFGSPDEYAYSLRDAGFDVFLTANNHCVDKGKNGIERTIQMLDSMQVKHLGTYIDQNQKDISYPLMIIKNGIRIVLLNYTYDTNGIPAKAPNIVNLIDKKQILADLELAKQMKPDIIIANMHWGDEYKLFANQTQKNLANFLIKNGVRLVIGGHPHVVQPIDIQKEDDEIKNIVVYSMGNLISGMRAVNTDGGMMVNIDLSKNDDGEVNIDSCSYSLVWVHKPLENGRQQFQLIPVEEYDNEEGKEKLGATAFARMKSFATTAKKAIEIMWEKPTETITESKSGLKN